MKKLICFVTFTLSFVLILAGCGNQNTGEIPTILIDSSSLSSVESSTESEGNNEDISVSADTDSNEDLNGDATVYTQKNTFMKVSGDGVIISNGETNITFHGYYISFEKDGILKEVDLSDLHNMELYVTTPLTGTQHIGSKFAMGWEKVLQFYQTDDYIYAFFTAFGSVEQEGTFVIKIDPVHMQVLFIKDTYFEFGIWDANVWKIKLKNGIFYILMSQTNGNNMYVWELDMECLETVQLINSQAERYTESDAFLYFEAISE